MPARRRPAPAPHLLERRIARLSAARRGRLAAVDAAARSLGVRAWLVGGVVRDTLLGQPVRDLDIVVEGDAAALARRLARETRLRVVVHPRFGTARLVTGDGDIDLVSARRERYVSAGALPEVELAGIEDDLRRRDFGINALALPLPSAPAAELLDPTGGMRDLQRGVIRILHRLSFRDDPTRVFRALRYAGRLGFGLEQDTERALQTAVRAGRIALLSPARIAGELSAVAGETRLPDIARALARAGVLAAVHGALAADEAALKTVQALAPRLRALQCPARLAALLLALLQGKSAVETQGAMARVEMPRRFRSLFRNGVSVPASGRPRVAADAILAQVAHLDGSAADQVS